MADAEPMGVAPSAALIEALRAAREAEKAQTIFYRALAGLAEDAGDAEAAERLNGLLADEQHHFSRISARLQELGHPAGDSNPVRSPTALAEWESVARGREHEEVTRYSEMLEIPADGRTRAMIAEFLEAERRHEAELGGKWMNA
jgi:rubrerythrin